MAGDGATASVTRFLVPCSDDEKVFLLWKCVVCHFLIYMDGLAQISCTSQSWLWEALPLLDNSSLSSHY